MHWNLSILLAYAAVYIVENNYSKNSCKPIFRAVSSAKVFDGDTVALLIIRKV